MNTEIFNYMQTIKNVSRMTGREYANRNELYCVELTTHNGKLILVEKFANFAFAGQTILTTFADNTPAFDAWDAAIEVAMFLGVELRVDDNAQANLKARQA